MDRLETLLVPRELENWLSRHEHHIGVRSKMLYLISILAKDCDGEEFSWETIGFIKEHTSELIEVIIDETYHIDVNEKGHTLYSKLKTLDKEGNPQYKAEGYFRTIEQALAHTAKLKVLSSHSEMRIDKYLKELKRAVNELNKAVQE